MLRTTIMLPEELRARATRRARKLGISLAEFIRAAMTSMLESGRGAADEDPLFKDNAVYDGAVPRDAAARHDEYLYEKPERRK